MGTLRPRLGLLLLAYFAFISLGLPDGLLGVAWPTMRDDFSVPTSAVGLIVTASTIGYLMSSVAAGFALSWIGVGGLLAASTALVGVSLIGYAVSPALALIVGLGWLVGAGSGAIDSALNAYAAGAFGPRHMNWLHAFFGLGVALGPLTMTAVLELGLAWRWGYVIVAVAQLALALAFLLSVPAWGRGPRAEKGVSPPPWRTLTLPAVWLGVFTFATYTAIEVGAGLWAYLLLTEGRGMGSTAAGLCVAGYWGSLFVGRLIQGEFAERFGAARVLSRNVVGMVVGALFIAIPAPAAVAVVGLVVLAFTAAPVFPLLTLTTAQRVGAEHADRAIGMQVGAAALGGALLVSGMGVVITDRFGLLGLLLFVLSLVLWALYVVSTRLADNRSAEPAPVE